MTQLTCYVIILINVLGLACVPMRLSAKEPQQALNFFKHQGGGFQLSYPAAWNVVDIVEKNEIYIGNLEGKGLRLRKLHQTRLSTCEEVKNLTEEGSDTYPANCTLLDMRGGNKGVLIAVKTSTGEIFYEFMFASPGGIWNLVQVPEGSKEGIVNRVKSIAYINR